MSENKVEIGMVCQVLDENSREKEIVVLSIQPTGEINFFSNDTLGKQRINQSDLVEGAILKDFTYNNHFLESLNTFSIKQVYGKLKHDKSSLILREYIKNISTEYIDISNENQVRKVHIPPTGKVVGKDELRNMIDASLDLWLTTGRFNTKFESELATFLNVKYVLTTNSGSSSNLLAMTALTSPLLKEKQILPGDEVITVASGFPTTISPIIQNGLIPVFVDVCKDTYNIDISQIEEALTHKTKAIFIAHALGNPFDLDPIMDIAKQHNLWVVEDNCDSLGSLYNNKLTGTVGHISTSSFYPAHHITTGEGGAVATNSTLLKKIMLSLRDWGRDCWCEPGCDNTCNMRFSWKLGSLPEGYDHKYTYSHLGYNLKLTDWQASIGLAQLKKLPTFIQKRRENFSFLYENLKKWEHIINLPKVLPGASPSWFGFIISINPEAPFTRTEMTTYLEEKGVGTRNLFAGNFLRQPLVISKPFKLRVRHSECLSSENITEEHFNLLPNADYIMNQSLWFGVWPGISQDELNHMLNVIDTFLRSRGVSDE